MSTLLIHQVINQGNVQVATTSSVPEEDTVLLGGQTFAIRGPIQGTPVSEFEAGFKTGRLKYDNREQAFFFVEDDWSGGFGHRFLDLDADIGTFWDTNPVNAPDLRRPGHATLGPKVSRVSLGTTEHYIAVQGRRPGKNWLLFDGACYFLIGDAVFYQPRGQFVFQKVYTHNPTGGSVALGPGSLAVLGDGIAGNGSRVYAFFTGHGFFYGYADLGAGNAWDGNDNPEWHMSDRQREGVWDGIGWDAKIVGTLGQNGIMYAVWDADNGREAWNFSDPDDNHLLFYEPGSDQIVFIGTFQSPWGEPSIFFYIPTKGIWALDLFARKAYPIDAGLTQFIQYAIPWNGSLAFTDGNIVRLYNNDNVKSITPIDLPHEGGVPHAMESQVLTTYSDGAKYRRASLVNLIASDNYLYAVAQRPHGGATGLPEQQSQAIVNFLGADAFLMCYNGSGWAPLGEVVTNFFPQGGFQFDDASYQSVPPVRRSLYIPGMGSQAGGAGGYSNIAQLMVVDIPDASQAPSVGGDHFAASGAWWVSGWFDGGFNDFDGAIFRMSIDAFSLTMAETVKVEYQLDNNETNDWIQMVDINNSPAVFDAVHRTLYYAQDAGLDNPDPRRGLRFRTIRWRRTLTRGSNDTLSPEVRAFTSVYIKKPDLRTQWVLPVDINRMIERSAPGNDDGGYTVDGSPATVANVWMKLKQLWDRKTLLNLSIPGVEEDLLVSISDMPINFDDFRDSVDGRGIVNVTVVQPLASVAP